MKEPLHYGMYLVCYDTDAQGLYDRTRTGFLLRAAVLAELAICGRVTDADGDVRVMSPGPTGDPVLDEALTTIGGQRRTWKAWVRNGRKETLEAVERHLATLGALTIEEKKAFGLASRRHVTATDTAAVKALQRRLIGVLRGNEPVERVAMTDVTLVALAAAGGVRCVVSRSDSHDHKERIDALTGRLGDAAPGLGRAVRGIRTTMVAAQGGMGGG